MSASSSKSSKELKNVRDRAKKFEEDFKEPSAGGCAYTPEAVFLSKLDGRVYPLVLHGRRVPR